MKAFWIRTAERTVEVVDYNGLNDLQRMVAGPRQGRGTITLAGYFRRNTVFVNDEGLYTFDTYFDIEKCGQGLFAGNGVVVGTEIGDTSRTRNPTCSIQELTQAVKFVTRMEAAMLARQRGI